jgi:hypothetical protein
MDAGTEAMIEGLKDAERDVGATVGWAGEEFVCVGGAASQGKRLAIGGYTPMADVTLVVRKAALNGTALPAVDDSVDYTSSPEDEAVSLKVRNIVTIRGAVYVLDCDHDSQGA